MQTRLGATATAPSRLATHVNFDVFSMRRRKASPKLVYIGLIAGAKFEPKLLIQENIRSMVVEACQQLFDIGPNASTPGQVERKLGGLRSVSAQACSSILGQRWPNCGPVLVKLGSNSTVLVPPTWAGFGRFRPSFDPYSTAVAQVRPEPARFWQTSASIPSVCAAVIPERLLDSGVIRGERPFCRWARRNGLVPEGRICPAIQAEVVVT